MPDALETNCSKCTDRQREMSTKVVAFLIDNRPNYWKPLQEKYDPDSTYTTAYLASKHKLAEDEEEEEDEK